MFENLHNHTKTSDGDLDYKESLKIAKENSVGVVAFTDHDSVMPKQIFNSLKSDIKWISGIEISSALPIEMGGKPVSNFHIVGLFVNPLNKNLVGYCQKMQESRRERMSRMVKNLTSMGFVISKDNCLRESSGEAVTRPHIVAALKKHKENKRVMEKIREKIEKESEEVKAKYLYPTIENPGQAPYSFFLAPNSYIKGVFVDYLYGLDLDSTTRLIRGAGGVSILAHWTPSKNKIGKNMVEKLLKEKRIDGVEVVYSPTKNKKIEKQAFEDMKDLKKLAKKYNAIQSGGADSHSKEDWERFFGNNKLAEKTRGLLEKILEIRPNLDKRVGM